MHKTGTAQAAVMLQGGPSALYLANTGFTTQLLNQLGYLSQLCAHWILPRQHIACVSLALSGSRPSVSCFRVAKSFGLRFASWRLGDPDASVCRFVIISGRCEERLGTGRILRFRQILIDGRLDVGERKRIKELPIPLHATS